MRMFKGLLEGLLELISPRTCASCKKRIDAQASIEGLVCLECWDKIKRNTPPFCHCCGRHLDRKKTTSNICPACQRAPSYFDRALSPCVYEGALKTLIHEFKYKNKDYLGPALARLLIDFVKEYDIPMDVFDMVVPMPLSAARLREREFNQSEILSECLAKEFHKTSCQALRRMRYSRPQAELKMEERISNVKADFSAQDNTDLKGKNIILVDDVLTTTATSSEAAKTLKSAGANIVFVLTLAN